MSNLSMHDHGYRVSVDCSVRHSVNMLTRKLKISSTYIVEAIHHKNSLTKSMPWHWLIIYFIIKEFKINDFKVFVIILDRQSVAGVGSGPPYRRMTLSRF